MPQFNRRELDVQAKKYGFNRDTFEKVLRLKSILEYLNTEEYLRQHLLLKGGTAINLTIFHLPRLSVDIDLDFIPNLTKEDTASARKKLTELLQGYMAEQGYTLSPASRYSHSLDAFHYNYINAAGNRDMLKIEINYSLRAHILSADERKVTTEAFGDTISIRTVAPIEIFAAKANALMSRAAARDLYDFCNMVDANLFPDQQDLFRKCIVFYATISAKEVNKSFDTSAIDSLTFSKIRADLFPVLAVKDKFDLSGKKQQAKTYISSLMKLTPSEREYMERFTDGEYVPELLFEETDILRRIKRHPMAIWKCSHR